MVFPIIRRPMGLVCYALSVRSSPAFDMPIYHLSLASLIFDPTGSTWAVPQIYLFAILSDLLATPSSATPSAISWFFTIAAVSKRYIFAGVYRRLVNLATCSTFGSLFIKHLSLSAPYSILALTMIYLKALESGEYILCGMHAGLYISIVYRPTVGRDDGT